MSEFGRVRHLSDGSIVYSKKGKEPPPDIDGYRRDPANFWRFFPLWEGCRFRVQNEYTRPCGAIDLKTTCIHPDIKKNVKHQQCAVCLLKEG